MRFILLLPILTNALKLDVSKPFIVPQSYLAKCDIAATTTPFYVYSHPHLLKQIETAKAFPTPFVGGDPVTVRFAMKSLPNKAVLQTMQKNGVKIDASSGYEIDRAVRAGFSHGDISLSTQELPDNIGAYIKLGVNVNACSLSQLTRIGQASKAMGEKFKCGIRINPGVGSGGFSDSTTGFSKTNVGGPQSSFGIWFESLNDGTIKSIVDEFNLEVERVHTHIGSGSDPDVWVKVVAKSLSFCSSFDTIKSINLGGGYKVARNSDNGEKNTDLQVVGTAIRGEFEKFKSEHGKELKLEIEPGTMLVANAGCVVSRVMDRVNTGGEGYTFLKMDCGMTDILRPSLYGARHPVVVYGKGEGEEDVVIVGHCCESGDLLTPKEGDPEDLDTRLVKKSEIGDFVVIGGAGAYCSSMSTKNYNSFPEAAEVMIGEGAEEEGVRVVRRRQTLEQMLENEEV